MTHINLRRDTAANWTAANPVLQLGETGWETDTKKVKMGDGVTAWTALDYIVSAEVTSVNGQTGVVVLDKDDVGLGAVDNTPDSAKPVSTVQQAAFDLKADLASPVFTGNPTAPTPTVGDNDTSVATTAFVRAEIQNTTPPELLVYTASSAFTKASYPGIRGVYYRMCAGGGAGGGSVGTSAGNSSGGSGGTCGGYSEGFVAVDDLAASETITIGAGGTGVIGDAGNDGGNTSFGTWASALGGLGTGGLLTDSAAGDVAGVAGPPGAGTGDYAIGGRSGTGAIRVTGTQLLSGKGGDSVLGTGGRSLADITGSVGVAGTRGGGGGGAISRNGEGPHSGGAGGGGVLLLELVY